MADVLDRIQKFIALATNHAATTEEARTVAMKVVKLIVEHKIQLSMPGSSPSPFASAQPHVHVRTPPPSEVDFISAIEDILRGGPSRGSPDFERFRRRVQEKERQARPSSDVRNIRSQRVAYVDTDNPHNPLYDDDITDPVAWATDERGPSANPRLMNAKFAGRCRVCRRDFDVGEPIFWMPGIGSNHRRCGVEGLEK